MAQIAEPAVAAPPAAPKVVRNLDGLALLPPKYVVGLDFGTTYSGFSFTTFNDKIDYQAAFFPEQVIFFENTLWLDNQVSYEKTPTVGLYDDSNHMAFWGWTAEAKKKEFPKLFLAHKFKLHLAELEDGETDTRSPLPPFAKAHADGAVIAISQYLRHMKDCILSVMVAKFGAGIKQEDIRWCLTVPAVWDDKAKLKMTKAAQLAGLVQGRLTPVGEGSPHPLQIVLEPEAASLYCLYWLKSVNNGNNLHRNSAYLVVDLGGGTADLAMHGFKIVDDNVKLVELQQGTGGLCGGSHVDDLFYKYLKEHVENWDDATFTMPRDLHKLREFWEAAKRTFKGDEKSLVVEVPRKIAGLLVQHFPNAGDDGSITISGETIKGFFSSVLGKIKRLIRQQIESLRQNQIHDIATKPITVFLVGGFSESEYVRNCVEAFINEQNKEGQPPIKVVSPTKPGITIARGACLFGLNPHAFYSRCVRRSYALEAYRLAVPTDPKKEQIKRPDGRFDVKGCVTSIYEGNIVEEGKPIKKPFKPHNPGDQKITIPLLTWTDPDVNAPDPEFSSDRRIKLAGINLEVIMPPADQLKNDTIIVEMEFNGPTISIKGYPEENVDMAVTVLLNLDDDAADE